MTRVYIESKGRKFAVDFDCIIEKEYENAHREGVTEISLYELFDWGHSWRGYKRLSVYWRPERTWDDHMGNTPCGYYVIVPLPTGERKRVYYA